MFCRLSHSALCCFCWGTLHQRLPIHATVLTTLLRCAATCNLLVFFNFCEAVSFFPSRSDAFFEFKSLLGELSECQLSGCGGANFIFDVPPCFWQGLCHFGTRGRIKNAAAHPHNLSHASLHAQTHMQTHTFISIHQASQGCDKLHLNVESVESFFLSAGSCQKPRHVTVPNARESQNHNLKPIYSWNVVILRWLGGKTTAAPRSLQN